MKPIGIAPMMAENETDDVIDQMNKYDDYFTVDEWAMRVGQAPGALHSLMSDPAQALKPSHLPGDSRTFITPSAWAAYQAQKNDLHLAPKRGNTQMSDDVVDQMNAPEHFYTVDEWARRVGESPEVIFALTSGATPSVHPTYKPGSSQVYITPEAWQSYKAQKK